MKSLSLIVSDAKRADANALMWALGRQDNPASARTQTFSVDMSPSRTPTATHWGAHTYDDALLSIVQSKVLPSGINWSAFGLTQTRAQQALDAIRFAAHDNQNANANFDALAGAQGVGRMIVAIGTS